MTKASHDRHLAATGSAGTAGEKAGSKSVKQELPGSVRVGLEMQVRDGEESQLKVTACVAKISAWTQRGGWSIMGGRRPRCAINATSLRVFLID